MNRASSSSSCGERVKFGHPKFARTHVEQRQAKQLFSPPWRGLLPGAEEATHGSEKIVLAGFQQLEIADRPRADDLADLPFDDFPRLRFAGLVADSDSVPALISRPMYASAA